MKTLSKFVAMVCGVGLSCGQPVWAESPVVGHLNEFSKNFFLKVGQEQTDNLAVSPLGSYILMALLHPGASGTTAEELAKVGNFSDTTLKDVGQLVEQLDALPSVSMAHSIYLDKRIKLVDAYQKKVARFFSKPVVVLDFKSDPAAATKVINDWVSKATQGLIQDFLPTLEPLTLSVLVSALHFKAQWLHPFPAKATASARFLPSDGKPVPVAMMRLAGRPLQVFTLPQGTGLILPYTDKVEMVLLLPQEGLSPDKFLEQLEMRDLPAAAPQEPREKQLVVQIPRFEFKVPTFKLNKTWVGLGLKQTVDDPNLNRMLELPDKSPLKMDIYHQTYIKVNEVGTEATAATAAVISFRGMVEQEQLTFDRAFLFLIRHSDSGAILMLGRVEHPEIMEHKAHHPSQPNR